MNNHSDTYDDGNSRYEVAIEEVGPDLAKVYLKANLMNRNIRPNHLDTLTRDYSGGKYTFTGAPIIFSDSGVLLDGQHRLAAVIKAEVTLPFVVVRGVPSAHQLNMDTGQKRKFGDVLTMRGYAQGKELAALVRIAWGYETDRKVDASRVQSSNAELMEFFELHPELVDCIAPGQAAAKKWRARRSLMSLAYWVFDRKDHAENVSFWALLHTTGLEDGHPVAALQNRFVREMASPATTQRMTRQTEMAITIKAWNAYIRGETISQLKWRAGGHAAEAFPEPLGPIE